MDEELSGEGQRDSWEQEDDEKNRFSYLLGGLILATVKSVRDVASTGSVSG